KQNAHRYLVFFNINICRNNLEDVRKLTEYAHDHRIATDYHINETPMLEQDDHFKHLYDTPTYILPEVWGRCARVWLERRWHEGERTPGRTPRVEAWDRAGAGWRTSFCGMELPRRS